MKKKILLTGSTGFIGKSLTDNLYNSKLFEINLILRKNDLIISSGVKKFFISDFANSNPALLTEAFVGVECVVHLAGMAHLRRSSAKLTKFRHVNVKGTLNLAKQAATSGVRRFIFISSIGVNGAKTACTPFSESSSPNPKANYAVSKLEAEEELKSLCASTGMEFVIIRPPLVYDSHAPGNFGRLLQIVAKEWPLPLSLVKNCRSMVALENLVDFIKLCVEHPKAANQTFLIADRTSVSTPHLIRLLGEGMNKKVRLIPVPTPLLLIGASLIGKHNTYQQLCGSLEVDTTKAQNLLNWHPPIDIENGLRSAGERYSNEKGI